MDGSAVDIPQEHEQIFYMVADLLDPEKREQSLLELSKRRERVPDLAIILWYSYGTIAALLNEIVSVYPLLSPPKLKVFFVYQTCTHFS
jgi:CCR4-NOT transcription complex subunit 9